jgi:hypothetical protein
VTATINYDRPVANYIDRITDTGHVTNTAYRKTSVTFHHNGGRLSLDGIYQVWRQRRASAHFQVDSQGNVGQYVDVRMYAWATGNTEGNKRTISIEQANKTTRAQVGGRGGDVEVGGSARCLAALEGSRRSSGQGKTLFRHHDWAGANTECAGPFIDAMWGRALCRGGPRSTTLRQARSADPKPVPVTLASKVRSFQTLLEVTSDGKWSDLTDDRAQRMRAAAMVHTYAGRMTFDVRDVQKVIDATVDGEWGPNTQAKLEQWVPQAQRVLGVKDDGVWGEGTDERVLESSKPGLQQVLM